MQSIVGPKRIVLEERSMTLSHEKTSRPRRQCREERQEGRIREDASPGGGEVCRVQDREWRRAVLLVFVLFVVVVVVVVVGVAVIVLIGRLECLEFLYESLDPGLQRLDARVRC